MQTNEKERFPQEIKTKIKTCTFCRYHCHEKIIIVKFVKTTIRVNRN